MKTKRTTRYNRNLNLWQWIEYDIATGIVIRVLLQNRFWFRLRKQINNHLAVNQ